MKCRRSRMILITIFVFSAAVSRAETTTTEEFSAGKGLVHRLLPGKENIFKFEFITPDNGNDVFELESVGDQIVIRGNNALAQAVGLNWYLKYYCNTSVSWFLAAPVEVPDKLPRVGQKIHRTAKCKYRFFLNCCTFGYTMPWWSWEDWQRFIDWMALNGINMPLAITGQEAVWQKVWKEFGLSDEQVRSYFTGPAHLPWHQDGNIDSWCGPLPQSYIDNQLELQQKILKREREFGMKPALPAFAGHVPGVLKELRPELKITKLKSWCHFSEKYNTYFLDPQDPLFTEIQQHYLKEQTLLFGTDHIYAADPFNEMTPPNWEPEYLANVASTIYKSMASVDKDAQWLQMGWMFYFDSHWTKPRVKAELEAVPQDKIIILDYYCDYTEVWRLTDAFFGQPYIWCYVGGFGGNTFLVGNLQTVNDRITGVFSSSQSGKIQGVGATLEALSINPVMYEFVMERVWDCNSVDIHRWIAKYAQRRCGQPDKNVEEAWKILIDKVYTRPAVGGEGGTIVSTQPYLSGHVNWFNPNIHYDNTDLLKVWELMLQAKSKSRDSYLHDLVNVASQTLANYALVLKNTMISDYNSQDINAFDKSSSEFLDVVADIDRLAATRDELLLGKWLKNAKSFGIDETQQRYYEHNARVILTTWGEKGGFLNDYANRDWAGLIKGYYLKRWQLFVKELKNSLNSGTAFDTAAFHDKVSVFEWNWTLSNEEYSSKPVGDSLKIAEEFYGRYAAKISTSGHRQK